MNVNAGLKTAQRTYQLRRTMNRRRHTYISTRSHSYTPTWRNERVERPAEGARPPEHRTAPLNYNKQSARNPNINSERTHTQNRSAVRHTEFTTAALLVNAPTPWMGIARCSSSIRVLRRLAHHNRHVINHRIPGRGAPSSSRVFEQRARLGPPHVCPGAPLASYLGPAYEARIALRLSVAISDTRQTGQGVKGTSLGRFGGGEGGVCARR
jgi:hypothetical protein